MSVFRGEKIGLVGPNGSGKSTIFRLIVREDQPDAGGVVIEKGVTIGYFSQDVGEMKGRSVVEETMAGAGELSSLRTSCASSSTRWPTPIAPTSSTRSSSASARCRRASTSSAATRSRPARARSSRASASRRGGRRRRGQALGRLEDARRARAHPPHEAGRAPARRADQPPRHRVDPLARAVPAVRGRARDDLARSRVPEPPRDKIVEIDGGELTTYTGNYDFYERPAHDRRAAAGGAVRAPAGDAREGRGVHRALQGAREPRRAGAVPREEAREDRARRAAQAPQRDRVRLREAAALGRRRRQARARPQGLRRARDLRRLRLPRAPPRALVRHGRQRRRQVHAAQAHRGRERSRTRAPSRSARA
jgi:ATPase subunit of ABC transporter with duplicated ATPase domains